MGTDSMVRPARRCGPRRPSTCSVRRSMSRPGTTIPTLPRKRAMRSRVRACDRPDALASAGHRERQLYHSCLVGDRINCPESNGPDYDFGQSPILVTLRSGQRVLVAGRNPASSMRWILTRRANPLADADRRRWSAGRDHVGLRRRSGPCLCRELRRAVCSGYKSLIRMRVEACSRSTLLPGKFPCRCRRSRVAAAARAARTLRSGDRYSRCGFFGRDEWYLRAYATDDARLLWEVDTARDYPIVNGGRPAEAPWTDPAQRSSTVCST